MIRYLQKKEVWVLAISTMKYRPDPVAAAVVPVGDVVSNPGDFKIRLLAGSEKAERLPAINTS